MAGQVDAVLRAGSSDVMRFRSGNEAAMQVWSSDGGGAILVQPSQEVELQSVNGAIHVSVIGFEYR